MSITASFLICLIMGAITYANSHEHADGFKPGE